MKEENQDVLDYVITEDEVNKDEGLLDNNEVKVSNDDVDTRNNENVTNPKEHKVPDILGNNKLGYNIWDTIVKGV